MISRILVVITTLFLALTAQAKTQVYIIDPAHTFPSFEADHMGISVWRGKVNSSSGEVLVDKEAQTGTLTVVLDMSSVDFGLDAMNQKAQDAALFNVKKFPTATYTGTLSTFIDGAPTKVKGNLTLLGISQPLDLVISKMKCIEHPFFKREVCGADATATFDRAQFGMDLGKEYGFDMTVNLYIQVEANAK